MFRQRVGLMFALLLLAMNLSACAGAAPAAAPAGENVAAPAASSDAAVRRRIER